MRKKLRIHSVSLFQSSFFKWIRKHCIIEKNNIKYTISDPAFTYLPQMILKRSVHTDLLVNCLYKFIVIIVFNHVCYLPSNKIIRVKYLLVKSLTFFLLGIQNNFRLLHFIECEQYIFHFFLNCRISYHSNIYWFWLS